MTLVLAPMTGCVTDRPRVVVVRHDVIRHAARHDHPVRDLTPRQRRHLKRLLHRLDREIYELRRRVYGDGAP